LDNPVTAAVVEGVATVTLAPGGLEVTVYEVIGLPPSETGAFQDTVACESPAMAATPVGALGTAASVTALDANDGGPVPTSLVAVTAKVYVLPLTSPVTNALVVAPGTMTAPPGGVDVTM
jgi:hypothetical protein